MLKFWAAAFCFLSVLSLPAQDWLGFHGLEHQGVAPQGGAAITWTSQIHTHWQAAIPGHGFSSPVVVGDRVYLTTAYETDRGSTARKITTVFSYVLAWLLLVLALFAGIHHSRPEHPKTTLVAAALLITAAFFLVALSSFGKALFGLENSIVRSWKIGVIASFVSVGAAWLASRRTRAGAMAFAVAATLLGVFALVALSNRNTFLQFNSSAAIINTGIVLGPGITAWILCLIILFAGKRGAQFSAHQNARQHSRLVTALIVLILPAVLTAAAFGVLAARVHRPGSAATPLVPEFGWPLFGALCLVASLALLFGKHLLSRLLAPQRTLQWSTILIATALAVAFFLRFAAFPSQREIAHAVVSVTRGTGEMEWIRNIAFSPRSHDFKGVNSRATPTLAAAPQGLAAFFGPGGLYGLSLNGKVRWHSQAVSFDTEFGIGHSPVTADGVVVLANEHQRDFGFGTRSHISAYDIADGDVVWRNERPRTDARSAGYSTPIIRTVSGRKVVIMRGWEDLAAYDLHTGQTMWTYPLKHRGNHLVASVVVDDQRAYVLDATRALALDLQKLAQQSDPVVWLVPVPGEKASSPVISDDLLFVATETGLALCMDAANGKMLWREKLGKRFFASVVAQGNALVFADEKGEISFVRKSPRFELIARVKLNENVYATPVPQTGGLLVRGMTNLFYLTPQTSG